MHDVTGALKDFFKSLPDPLLTHTLYPKFIDTMSKTQAGKRGNTCMYSHTYMYMYTHIHTHVLTHNHTQNAHTRTHARTHTHTHTHTHTEVQVDHEQQLHQLKDLINQLPPVNRETLKRIIIHLNRYMHVYCSKFANYTSCGKNTMY